MNMWRHPFYHVHEVIAIVIILLLGVDFGCADACCSLAKHNVSLIWSHLKQNKEIMKSSDLSKLELQWRSNNKTMLFPGAVSQYCFLEKLAAKK